MKPVSVIRKVTLTSIVFCLLFVLNTHIAKANFLTDQVSSAWSAIINIFNDTPPTPTPQPVPPTVIPTPKPVVIPPSIINTPVITTPPPSLHNIVSTNAPTITDEQLYKALSRLNKLPDNIVKQLRGPEGKTIYVNDDKDNKVWRRSRDNAYYDAGNVGIGTNSPDHTLTVDGTLSVSGTSVLSDILPAVAATTTTGVVRTSITSVTDGSYLWDDAQKAIAIGADTFPRIVYTENGMTEVKFLQCLDQDCTTSNITTVDSNSNGVDNVSILMAPDGYARILYINYNTPNELHFVECNNSDCSDNVNTIVATQIYDGYYYAASFGLDSNGNAYIGVEDYDDGTSTDHLEFYACTNAECTTHADNELLTGPDTYYEMFAIVVGSDNLARIAVADLASPSNLIRYIQCSNADCSTNSNTIVDIDETHYSFYLDLVLDSSNNAYIAYSNQEGYKVAQCTNADCSSSNISVIDSSTSSSEVSIVLGNDGFPRISYAVRDVWPVSPINYIQCTNADCSSKKSLLLDTDSFYTNSIALGADGLPRIVYANSARDSLYLVRFGTNDGEDIYTGKDLGSSSTKFNSIYGQTVNADSLYLNGNSVDLSALVSSQWTTSGSDIYFNGDVGIGTSTPVGLLDVNSKLTVLSNGNVGIGTTTPTHLLEVGGVGYFSSSLLAAGLFPLNTAQVLTVGNGGGTLLTIDKSIDSGGTANAWFTGGNIGIGSTNPSQKLHVSGGSVLVDGLNNAILTLNKTQDSVFESSLYFNSAGVNMGKITLDNNNDFSLSGPNNFTTRIIAGNSAVLSLQASANSIITLSANNVEAMRVNTSGQIGINCSDPDHLLELGGTGTGCNTGTGSYINAGDTAFTANSSREWKDNIQDYQIENILEKINSTPVHTYDWKQEYCEGENCKDKLGFIAQEFYTVLERGDGLHVSGQDVQMAEWLGIQALYNKFLSLKTDLALWFGDATNGIGKLFAKEVHTDELCVGEVCVTEEQFLNIVNQSGGPANVVPVEPTPDRNPLETQVDPVVPEGAPVEEPSVDPVADTSVDLPPAENTQPVSDTQ